MNSIVPSGTKLEGTKVGAWLVLRRAENINGKVKAWHCLCDCGVSRIVRDYCLRKETSRSCGCVEREARKQDLVGQRFGRLIVVASAPSDRNGSCWACLCDCGKTKTIAGKSLKGGLTKSCGCIKPRISHTAEYKTLVRMIARCHNPENPKYTDYGGRGIKVCDRWRNDPSAFILDMGIKPSPSYSIDRIENNGDYEPGNCRWATAVEQARNRRSNILVPLPDGRDVTLTEACEVYQQDYFRVLARIKKLGWTPLKALKTPSNRK